MKLSFALILTFYPLFILASYLEPTAELRDAALKLISQQATINVDSSLVEKSVRDITSIATNTPIDPDALVWALNQLYFAMNNFPDSEKFSGLKSSANNLATAARFTITDMNGMTIVSRNFGNLNPPDNSTGQRSSISTATATSASGTVPTATSVTAATSSASSTSTQSQTTSTQPAATTSSVPNTNGIVPGLPFQPQQNSNYIINAGIAGPILALN